MKQYKRYLAIFLFSLAIFTVNINKVNAFSGLSIGVTNPGIVLFQYFFQAYFSKLGLMEDYSFISSDYQKKAVFYLQYLSTGRITSNENELILNKLLCGIHPSEVIEEKIEITARQEEVTNTLIEAVIRYWPASGTSSITGFRGNWIMRPGILIEREDYWELIVGSRSYDVLLNRFPSEFKHIKHPWMSKPIIVTWEFK